MPVILLHGSTRDLQASHEEVSVSEPGQHTIYVTVPEAVGLPEKFLIGHVKVLHWIGKCYSGSTDAQGALTREVHNVFDHRTKHRVKAFDLLMVVDGAEQGHLAEEYLLQGHVTTKNEYALFVELRSRDHAVESRQVHGQSKAAVVAITSDVIQFIAIIGAADDLSEKIFVGVLVLTKDQLAYFLQIYFSPTLGHRFGEPVRKGGRFYD